MLTDDQTLASRPIFSETYELINSIPFFSSGTFLFRITDEERTNATPVYLNPNNPNCILIVNESEDSFTYSLNSSEVTIRVVDESQIENFLKLIDKSHPLYIDITGLSHHIWAILLKSCFSHKVKVKILYTEPFKYSLQADKPYSYDLSQDLSPIKPIPGFVVLRVVGSSNFTFIPLLGFEKRRFELMFTNVDPPQYMLHPQFRTGY